MSVTANQATSDLLRRTRDPSGLAFAPTGYADLRTFIRDLLTRAQISVNGATRSVIDSATLTTNARRLFYVLSSDVPTAIKVLFVRDNNNDLNLTTLRELNGFRQSWHRDIGARHDVYAVVGRDVLIVYPAKEIASTVTVISTKVTSTLAAEADTFDIPDSDVPAVMDLAEIIMLLKARKFDVVKQLGMKFQARIVERMHTTVGRDMVSDEAVNEVET